jgi:hypothetical protein
VVVLEDCGCRNEERQRLRRYVLDQPLRQAVATRWCDTAGTSEPDRRNQPGVPHGSILGVPHPDEPALVAYVAENSSAIALAVYDTTDPAAARAALRAAAAEICRIRHPDEPDTALPTWCAVLDEDGAPVLRLDMKDEIRYAALVAR